MMRAILLASATATTLQGRRARRAVIHLEALGLPRACLSTAVGPTTRSERNAGLPIFDMRPNRSLPPLECGFGVKPSQAAKCQPDLKPPGSGTSALTEAGAVGADIEDGQSRVALAPGARCDRGAAARTEKSKRFQVAHRSSGAAAL